MAATALPGIRNEAASPLSHKKNCKTPMQGRISGDITATNPATTIYAKEDLTRAVKDWEELPKDCLCPVSLEVELSVIVKSGKTFKQASAESWLREDLQNCSKENLQSQKQERLTCGGIQECVGKANGQPSPVSKSSKEDANGNSEGFRQDKCRARIEVEEIRQMLESLEVDVPGNGVCEDGNEAGKVMKISANKEGSCSDMQISIANPRQKVFPAEFCDSRVKPVGIIRIQDDEADCKSPSEFGGDPDSSSSSVQHLQAITRSSLPESQKKDSNRKKQFSISSKSFAESSSHQPSLLRRHSFASLALQREPSAPVDNETMSSLLNVIEGKVLSMGCEASVPNRACTGGQISAEGQREDSAAKHCTEELQSAVKALWNMSKISKFIRQRLGELSVVSIIFPLLSSKDALIQEYSITVLLNLALDTEAKVRIVASGAVDPLVRAIVQGHTVKARENAAGAISSLTVAPEGRIAIRNSGAIPLLVNMLGTGRMRARKDAAVGLFNLAIDSNCRIEIVHAGCVLSILNILKTPGMFEVEEEVVALLATLSKTHDACGMLEKMNGIRLLVGVLESGKSENVRINATVTLLQLAMWKAKCVDVIKREGGLFPLLPLSQSTSPRGRDKAASLMRLLRAAS